MSKTQNIKLAVDAVVFGYQNNQLYVLLIKQKFGIAKGKWSLPGGFVLNDESLTQAVERELQEEAGIKVNYLEQLYTFGDDVKRDPRNHTVTVAYFALVNPKKWTLKADTDAEDAQWFPIINDQVVQALPDTEPSTERRVLSGVEVSRSAKAIKLAYDHKKIIKVGVERLKGKLTYQPIGFDLLDKEFPFSDLEHLYGTILGKEIDRRNFRKKMLSFDILQETKKMKKVGSGRPAKLFTFNKQKYSALVKEGFHFEIKYV
ncbi:MAG: NUDIX domain-containing protein [Crocinitomicaceae bacterium]